MHFFDVEKSVSLLESVQSLKQRKVVKPYWNSLHYSNNYLMVHYEDGSCGLRFRRYIEVFLSKD